MIFVDRGGAPAGLPEKANQLKDEFAAARRLDPNLTASKFWSRARRSLRAEAEVLAARFSHKCAFCEARPAHVSSPHVEHYRPKGKSAYEHLMFEWSNWLPSCGKCNESKWAHFPECGGGVPCLLDPTLDDPVGHLEFFDVMVEGTSLRGWRTIKLLGLARAPLTRERAAWLLKIGVLLLLATLASDQAVKNEARRLLIWSMQSDAPYSAMTRRHLQRKAPKLANPVIAHPIIAESEGVIKIRELITLHKEGIAELA